jgi:hypothetical protein
MTPLLLRNWILRTIVLCSFNLVYSCGNNENVIGYSNGDELGSRSSDALSDPIVNNNENRVDTVTVQTAEELIKHIRSNRVIELINSEYILTSTLLIDSITNLKIVGTGLSRLMINERNSTAVKLLNSHHVQLSNLILGHAESPRYEDEQGVLRINHSQNIVISNCKVIGAGTFGLITYEVSDLKFTNSEITACTVLIFDLEKSRNIEFINSQFHNNILATSVLGGFTNSTSEVTFTNCSFLDNKPAMAGNPAFNFMDNSEDLDAPIIFSNCTFKNNKGFKWYGDKIELNDCEIDSTDFINFPENNR